MAEAELYRQFASMLAGRTALFGAQLWGWNHVVPHMSEKGARLDLVAHPGAGRRDAAQDRRGAVGFVRVGEAEAARDARTTPSEVPGLISRAFFLWASRQTWLAALVRWFPLTRPMVRRFIAGDDLDDALEALQRLSQQGLDVDVHRGDRLPGDLNLGAYDLLTVGASLVAAAPPGKGKAEGKPVFGSRLPIARSRSMIFATGLRLYFLVNIMELAQNSQSCGQQRQVCTVRRLYL